MYAVGFEATWFASQGCALYFQVKSWRISYTNISINKAKFNKRHKNRESDASEERADR